MDSDDLVIIDSEPSMSRTTSQATTSSTTSSLATPLQFQMAKKNLEADDGSDSDTRLVIHTNVGNSTGNEKYRYHNYMRDSNDNCPHCHDFLLQALREMRLSRFPSSPPPPPPPLTLVPPPPPPPPPPPAPLVPPLRSLRHITRVPPPPPPPSSLPPLPPPPPPPLSLSTSSSSSSLPPPPPPPPPPPMTYCPPSPPPPPPSGYSSSAYTHGFEIPSAETLIPANYANRVVYSPTRLIRILPFRRKVFMTSHRAQVVDFKEFEWLLKYGTTELWYEKPSKSLLKRIKAAEMSGCESEEPDELLTSNARTTEIQTPKVWASAALTTPTDGDIHKCTTDHVANVARASYARTCQQCTDEKSEALDATDLVYCIVFNTLQAHDMFVPGASGTGSRQIYKMVKCSSRETAVAEIFHTTGLNGWNVVFSCIMRASEDTEERCGKFRRVEEFWMLADNEDDDGDSIRVFY